MNMPNDLLYQFAKVVADSTPTSTETTLFGVITERDGSKYVKLDGSDLLTPISSTTNIESGERVMVTIKDHSAIVTGNITSPAARTEEVDNAAKVATNYMHQDSENGLQIGDRSTGQWQGYRTQVKSDSFDVLDENGTELSTFGANEIHLGKNNNDTEISMCNGAATIKVDTSEYSGEVLGAVIEADSLALKGPNIYTWSENEATEDGIVVSRSSFCRYQPASVSLLSQIADYQPDGTFIGTMNSEINVEYNNISLSSSSISLDGDVSVAGDIDVNGKRVLTEADITTGTWTARINAGTISTQYCTYVKVGNMCTISFFIQGTGAASSATNTHFYITGVPYEANDTARWYGGGLHVQGLKVESGYHVTGAIIQSSNNAIYLRMCQNNAEAPAGGYVCANNGKATFYLSGSITYPVA